MATKIEDEKDMIQHVDHPQTLHDTEAAKPKYAANSQLDDAARLLQEAGGHVEYTQEESRRVLRKIDIFVCLPMCLVYFVQQVGVTAFKDRHEHR